MKRTDFAALFLTFQAAAFALWWSGLALWPEIRHHFILTGAPEDSLFAFGPPDALVATASLLAAGGLRRGAAWAKPLFWVVAGAVVYATVYCVAGWLLTGGAALAAIAMTPCAAANIFVAARTH